tara:strand:+ start:376 stop:609 length:234 start_codon:yes stop_codon:yes gene_type:complete
MCIGGMRTSKPQVYKRPNPQDIYYNGNVYDPKPQNVIDAQNQAKADAMASSMLKKDNDGSKKKQNLLNKSSTGLQIT